jgi:erythromycin esterase-like protein
MKQLMIPFFLLSILYGHTQYQQQISKCETVIDEKGRFLDSLMKFIGNKRIVALGEDTHGTAEFYELRSAITQRLIQEKGFNILILENPHEDMMALQNGLQNEPMETLMRRHLFPIYQTRQMKAFLNWFKNYFSQHKVLHLAGCDDSRFGILRQQLIKEVAKYGNDSLNNLCQELLLRQTLTIKDFYAQQPQPMPDSLPTRMQFGQATWQLLNRIDSECKAQNMQDSTLKELLFQAKTNYAYYDRYLKKIAVSRDEIMGERVNYYAADPNARIIVWAHNAHIAKYAWLDNEIGLMGATILQQHSTDYVAIGLSGGQGSYSYIKNRFIYDDHNYTDRLFNDQLHKSKADSWNELLMKNRNGAFFLDFSKLDAAERSEFDKKRSLKLLGYGTESKTGEEYYDISLTQLFDGLIFLKSTTHTTALFK